MATGLDLVRERIKELDRLAGDQERTREKRLKSWEEAAQLKATMRRAEEALERMHGEDQNKMG
jgi:hypothetical protein